MTTFLLSAGGITLALAVLARFTPNEKLDAWGFASGAALSRIGAGKLGKRAWEAVENYLENSSAVFLRGVKRGLDADDEKKEENAHGS